VLALRNYISVELYKMRKNKVFIICSIIPWVIILLLLLVNNNSEMFENPINRLYNLFLVPNALMMMMSGFVLTTLIQREYQDHTMINVLTAPVARTKFIMSKLLAWFIWHFTTLAVVIIIFAVWY